MKNKERVYIGTLRLEPHKTNGTLVLIHQDIDEKLYNVISKNLYTKLHDGRVELGYTEKSGVKIRCVTTEFEDINLLIKQLFVVGMDAIQKGITGYIDDKMGGPLPELQYSIGHLEVLKDKTIPNNPVTQELKGLAYTIHPKVRTNFELKEVQAAMLVPPSAEAEIF